MTTTGQAPSTPPSDVTFSPLRVPPTLDGESGADFIEFVALQNELESHIVGSRELAYEPEEMLPAWLDAYLPRRAVIAQREGRIIGDAVYFAAAAGDAPEGWVTVEVAPEHRREGIGAALFDQIVDVARENGCRVLQSYCLSTELGEPRLPSPTGFGSAPLNALSTRFALTRGFTLEQVERYSRLPLPADADLVARSLAEAQAAAGPDYEVVTWQGRTPEMWLDDIALLSTRMSTDAPSAGLTATEDVWDANRVREHDDLRVDDPRLPLVAAALHLPSGRLAGFTELSVPPQSSRIVTQEDTLVLHEHRGHRLGMLLKLANINFLESVHPGHPAIITFNAEENRHMLSVNEHVGFIATGYEAVWKRDL
jgi:GNAT superfamily N-acetyltransferase